MKNKILKCNCSSLEHIIVVSSDEDFKEDVVINVHLTNLSFWKRLVYAFKYLLGYKCKYGSFEEIIINKDELLKTLNKL